MSGRPPAPASTVDLGPGGGSETFIPVPESSERGPPAREGRPRLQPRPAPSDDVGQAVVAAMGCGFAGGVVVTVLGGLALQWVLQ